eukprot:GEMP01010772.1.p1 GENE.GEMP01010772.1~~GEMP01010772.1.p1  ORF type:complete len:615 (+),score=90.32 GEMP01010772.1:51-1847(+)
MTQGVEFYFSSPHDTVEVLGKYFNDQHVNTFFSNLDVLLLRCIEGIVEGIVQAEDEQQMIEKIDILYQLCENDHNLAALVKRSKQGLLERLARRIMSPQNGATSVKCSINAIWLLRQICPEWLPEVQGVTHPDLLEQLLLAHANRLHYYRDVEPYESIDFALSVLQLRNHTSEDMRNKLNLASLTLLNRCIVECLRPSRFAVDYLINKGAVPLVVEAAKSSSSSTKNEDQKWAEEKVIQQAAELAIGLASVDGGRERLLGCKFHETLMQSIMNVTADESKKWLIYCVATIGGPGVILECVQRVTSVANVEVSINYMRLSFQVLSSFIGDRMNEDLHSGEDGTKHFQHIISSLSFYLQTANQDSEDAHMLELLPELMRAIRSSVNKMNYLPQNEESYQVQRECLAVVFETVKKQSKNDGVVQTAVEVMGTILEHTTITSEVQQAIMIQLREAHRHHLSSKHTQHWILWTVLVLTDLPTMLTFMKEHKSSPAVQEGAICSLGDYFGQENDRGAIVDMGPISEAVHFVSQAMQRYPHLRSSGVRTLGALSGLYSVDHLPVKEPRSWRQEKPIYDGDMQAEKDAITDGLKLSTVSNKKIMLQ